MPFFSEGDVRQAVHLVED